MHMEKLAKYSIHQSIKLTKIQLVSGLMHDEIKLNLHLHSTFLPAPAAWVCKPLTLTEIIQGLFSYAVVLLMSCTLCSGSMVSGHRRIHGANTMAKALADMRLVSSCKAILKTPKLQRSVRWRNKDSHF